MNKIQPIQFNDLTIQDPEEMQRIHADLDRFMGDYKDRPEETLEALEVASRGGFIFDATGSAQKRLGLVVITPTPFAWFQPHYHLAYIATAPECRGQGIGKKLLEEALRKTEGDLALHVSPSNQAAIRFYEKQGWDIHYVRMMPRKNAPASKE